MPLRSASFVARTSILIIPLLLLIAGCETDSTDAERPPEVTRVVTNRIEPAQWQDAIFALGTVRASESVTLTAKVSETVRSIEFESGDQVEAGEVLVTLSRSVELAGLEEARAAYGDAERQLQRQKELSARQLVAASQIDTQRAAADAARARMDVVRAQLSDRVVTAPFDGVLGLRQVSIGSLVTPGTPIATLDDIAVMHLDFSIPERALSTVERGQQVVGRSETYPEREFRGVVADVDTRVDPVTRSTVVRAEIANEQRFLRPGMLLSVTLLMPARQTLVVPEIAVLQVGLDSFVYRVAADDIARRVPVVLGARRPGEVEVSRGLSAGDRIVTEGIVKLSDGARVSEAASDTDAQAPAAAAPATPTS